MTTKQLFLKRTDMRDRLLAFVKQDWFQEALIYCQSLTLEGRDVTPDFVRGANAFKDTLLTIADDEEPMPRGIASGLCHDIDEPRKKTADDNTKEKA